MPFRLTLAVPSRLGLEGKVIEGGDSWLRTRDFEQELLAGLLSPGVRCLKREELGALSLEAVDRFPAHLRASSVAPDVGVRPYAPFSFLAERSRFTSLSLYGLSADVELLRLGGEVVDEGLAVSLEAEFG